MSSSSFRLSVEIRLSGELDLLTASEVRSELLAVAKSTHAPEIAVDLEEVAFVDTAGLKPLVEAQRLLNRSDRTLRLRNVPLPVARLIRAADLASTFDVVEVVAKGGGNAPTSPIPAQRARPYRWSGPDA
jgi:anti-anti-sigma factor